MPQKRKFNPEITRVKLNPEQTVLTCGCYNTGSTGRASPGGTNCVAGTKSYKSVSAGTSAASS